MKKLIVTCACLALAGCSDDKETTTDTGTGATNSQCDSSLTFDNDINSIVQSGGTGNCADCHQSYATLNGISADKNEILERVKSTSLASVMPQNDLNFKSSTDGTKLISWLSCDTLN